MCSEALRHCALAVLILAIHILETGNRFFLPRGREGAKNHVVVTRYTPVAQCYSS